MNVIIGTRGSKLALAQAEYVKNRLQKHYPQNSYELKIISTKGDREQKKALDQMGDKGLFVREIEQELLDGTISLAVHSMKDMPAEQPSGLVFAHAWKREDPRDVLILREAVSLEELPQHAVIGTGSRRRAFQLLQLRNHGSTHPYRMDHHGSARNNKRIICGNGQRNTDGMAPTKH